MIAQAHADKALEWRLVPEHDRDVEHPRVGAGSDAFGRGTSAVKESRIPHAPSTHSRAQGGVSHKRISAGGDDQTVVSGIVSRVSVATEQARSEFSTALRDPRNAIVLSQGSQGGPGRRHRAPSLHRAAVVLTAAAWQAFAEDLTQAILADIAVAHGDPGWPLYNLVKATTTNALGRFNTPNARNTLALYATVGFDPEQAWTFSIGNPARSYSSSDVRSEIDGWLEVRHKIAHGAQLPATALVSGRTQHGPSLHRKDAERCVAFFEAVVQVTSDVAAVQFP
jgi:hypothetical protein